MPVNKAVWQSLLVQGSFCLLLFEHPQKSVFPVEVREVDRMAHLPFVQLKCSSGQEEGNGLVKHR